jgi:hypothetical protein
MPRSNKSREEIQARMDQLYNSSSEVITDYVEMLIDDLHQALELTKPHEDVRFIQGQIAGIREFCSVDKE